MLEIRFWNKQKSYLFRKRVCRRVLQYLDNQQSEERWRILSHEPNSLAYFINSFPD